MLHNSILGRLGACYASLGVVLCRDRPAFGKISNTTRFGIIGILGSWLGAWDCFPYKQSVTFGLDPAFSLHSFLVVCSRPSVGYGTSMFTAISSTRSQVLKSRGRARSGSVQAMLKSIESVGFHHMSIICLYFIFFFFFIP